MHARAMLLSGCVRASAACVGALGLSSGVIAGSPGDTPSIAWRVEVSGFVGNRPAIGPNGEVAVQSRELVVVEHDGEVRWRNDTILWANSDSICDIDDQGRIYANSRVGLRAFSPSGDPLWTLPALGGSYSHRAGPTVGPDGNIYFIDDNTATGYGFGSVTPSGDLRWNLPGWGDSDSDFPKIEVLFSDGLAIGFAPSIPENCGGNCLGSGAMALRMSDGEVEWVTQTTAPFVPAISPSGRILVPGIAKIFRLNAPANGALAQVTFDQQPIGVGRRLSIRDDNVGFGVSSLNRLVRIAPDDTAVTLTDQAGVIMSAPEVSPDGSLIVAGTAVNVLPSPASIKGIDAETGEILWSIPLPEEDGVFPQATGHPRFSPDGTRVYMGVVLLNRSFLYAIDLAGPDNLLGDTNADGVVNFADLNAVLSQFGSEGEPGFTGADVNGDGAVNFADLNTVLSNFGNSLN